MNDQRPQEGVTLGGRYRLTGRIAAGGMGEVWRAEDQVLGRTVALKLLKAGLTDEEGFTERFRNEARLSATLTHGNVAQVYDFGQDEAQSYLVMEFVNGPPLSKLISARAPMSPIDTVEIIAQAAAALHAAHRNGLIHRDVKPANILIDPDGTAKLTDFGIARAVGQTAMTRTGEVMGTAQYLAPEAAVGRPATPLSDVYALGVVAYEMLAGRRPFEKETAVALALAHVNEQPPPLPPHVPPTLRAVVLATLEKDPGRRPNSAAEFGRAMRQALRDADRMGMLGARPQRGPMGQQGPRALSSDQQAQRHPSGPQPTGAQPSSRPPMGSGPQQTGSRPAQPPMRSGPNRAAGAHPPMGSGPQQAAGSRPAQPPMRSGPNPATGANERSGPQRNDRSGPQRTAPGPAEPQTRRERRAEEPRREDHLGEAVRAGAASAADGSRGASSPGTAATPVWQRPQTLIIAGAVVLVLIIGIILALTIGKSGDDGDDRPVDPNQPQNVRTTFQKPLETVSMPRAHAPAERSLQ